jgi:hypothetical protein
VRRIAFSVPKVSSAHDGGDSWLAKNSTHLRTGFDEFFPYRLANVGFGSGGVPSALLSEKRVTVDQPGFKRGKESRFEIFLPDSLKAGPATTVRATLLERA